MSRRCFNDGRAGGGHYYNTIRYATCFRSTARLNDEILFATQGSTQVPKRGDVPSLVLNGVGSLATARLVDEDPPHLLHMINTCRCNPQGHVEPIKPRPSNLSYLFPRPQQPPFPRHQGAANPWSRTDGALLVSMKLPMPMLRKTMIPRMRSRGVRWQ